MIYKPAHYLWIYEHMTNKQREEVAFLVKGARSPEEKSEQQRVRELLDKEVAETGGITTTDGVFHRVIGRVKRQAETFDLPPDVEIPPAAGWDEDDFDLHDAREAISDAEVNGTTSWEDVKKGIGL